MLTRSRAFREIEVIYKAPVDDLIGDLMESDYSDFFVRRASELGQRLESSKFLIAQSRCAAKNTIF